MGNIPDFIKVKALTLDEAQKKNFGTKESGGAGWDIYAVMWPNYVNRGSYANEINFLVDFVEKRIKWLDVSINGL